MGTFVQAASGEQTANNSTACTATFGVGTTAGNSLVWFWACEATTANRGVTVAGGGNTYVESSGNGAPLSAALPWQFRCGYALDIAAGTTAFTGTVSGGSAAFKAFFIAEYSGHATSGAQDFVSALQESTGTTRNAGTQTNSAAGTLIALLMDYDLLATPTAGGGFTSRATGWNFGGGTAAARLEDATYATSGSRSATFGTNTNAESFAGQIFLLDAAAGGGDGPGMGGYFRTRTRPRPFGPGLGR